MNKKRRLVIDGYKYDTYIVFISSSDCGHAHTRQKAGGTAGPYGICGCAAFVGTCRRFDAGYEFAADELRSADYYAFVHRNCFFRFGDEIEKAAQPYAGESGYPDFRWQIAL